MAASFEAFRLCDMERMMKRRKQIWIAGFAAGAFASFLLCGTAYYVSYGVLPLVGKSVVTGKSGSKAADIERMVERNYLEDVEQGKLEEGMYAGLLASLGDPYSGYFSAENYQRLKESSEGKYTGVGMILEQSKETGEIKVAECYADSPAAAAGIKAGDIIYKVGGELASQMDLTVMVNRIKDKVTQELQMTIKREGETELLEVTITPETIEVPVVSYRLLENQIGYLQIDEFTEGTSDQFKTGYDGLKEQGMKGLVVDLRNNPGGLLTSVCDTLEQILPEGMIVYTEDKYGNREEHTCEGKTPIQIPMVVLVNEESASAAEIFAGAVKDHGVGTLVGTTTFGKGIVQKIYPLDDGSAVKLTVSKYYTPNGVNIHGTGIHPDVEVLWPQDAEALENPDQVNELSLAEWLPKDDQMEKALEVLASIM